MLLSLYLYYLSHHCSGRCALTLSFGGQLLGDPVVPHQNINAIIDHDEKELAFIVFAVMVEMFVPTRPC